MGMKPVGALEERKLVTVPAPRAPSPQKMLRASLGLAVCAIVGPIAWAVFKLITGSNFDACSTGKSLGLAPFKIRST
jgi:hypothetical protein